MRVMHLFGGLCKKTHDALAKAVRVSTIRLGDVTWTIYANRSATFTGGDRLGARVLASGDIQIFKNGTLITTVTMSQTDRTFFNTKGGRIGILALGAPGTFFDDLGGGTIAP